MLFVSIPFDGFRLSLPTINFGESRGCLGEVTRYRVLAFLDSENATLHAGYSEYPSLESSEALHFFKIDKSWGKVLESLEWEEERDDGELFILWDDRSVRFVRAIAPEGEVTTRVYFAEVRIPVFFFDEDQLPWIRHYLSSLVPDPSLRWQNGSSCLVASSPVSQSSPYSRRESGGRSSRDHKCLINWMMKFVQWLRSP